MVKNLFITVTSKLFYVEFKPFETFRIFTAKFQGELSNLGLED